MAEYTQEQLDTMIAEAKKGLFSEEELNKRVQTEADRRVESGIQKGLETQKKKWQEEFEAKSKMTAEEIVKKEFEDKLGSITAKETELAKKANMIEAKSMLADAEVPKAYYEKFTTILVNEDETATKANVENFINMFNSTKSDIETKIKSEFTKIPKPQGNTSGAITKEQFKKMGYAEKLKFKENHPDLYKQFIN